MYDSLAMHIYQPSSDVLELSIGRGCEHQVWSLVGGTYKLKPIHVPIVLDELIDIPTIHPL